MMKFALTLAAVFFGASILLSALQTIKTIFDIAKFFLKTTFNVVCSIGELVFSPSFAQ